ncbi:aminotransferase class IV family protein [Frederiksenia canicola]|uniref:4-amino-4-deoxychorismate lyase n=1 Tax=Frederiksenia canicola TaxID=123824 RepID=A0AAE6X4N4_9PAST|nr:aminotransferase class IV family protein [Frederiksenia canicola]QIM64835.1 branched-chain amino acid aminotransferase [Frederiksenia canicola]RPE92241.1 4-amino-4-deoxychorismate lyase [Frederiksenia canicola]
MCQFPLFETLAVIDGQFQRLNYHQQRVNLAFEHFFKSETILDLTKITIPTAFKSGFFRCRIDYSAIAFDIKFYAYTPRKMTRFQCVYTEDLDYQFKYSDRKRLDFAKDLQIDEVIIINNGFVSDCTIGNLLFLKNEKWYSPQHYLLKGTQLTYLLDQQKVELMPIHIDDLFGYEKIMVINALNPFEPERAVSIDSSSVLR